MPDHAAALFSGLEPAAVWSHFATLCSIPRRSKDEARVREHVQQWAAARGLPTSIDGAGNLLVRKAATRGRQSTPGIVLQAHLDMVCQKNSDVAHDFARDPIRPLIRDGAVLAEATTLGADNGIGVALMLAVLEDASLEHGPIEALFTVDEEAGMGGARGLAAGTLQGRLMLNLDTETWGEFCVGCAGGIDVDVSRSAASEAPPEGFAFRQLALRGLRGGHSGVDIHEQRGNAIKLLVRVLRGLEAGMPLRLASLWGGSARNALPRECFAVIAVPAAREPELGRLLGEWQVLLRRELESVDDALVLEDSAAEPGPVMAAGEQAVWLDSLQAAPHGVRRFSNAFPGVVETSNNLGMVDLEAGGGTCNFMVRSLRDSGIDALADEIVSLFALSGTSAVKSGRYPGWTPDPASPLLALCQEVYRREVGGPAAVQVIHAGLECGLIAAKHPGLDVISLGPTIHGPHAPGEAVDIASVGRTWQLLKAILSAAG